MRLKGLVLNYTDKNRGKIQYRGRAQQIIDFSGLRYKNITPTDIDGFVEYQDKGFIFIEIKTAGAKMPRGQRVALERLCRCCANDGKQAFIILGSHTTAVGSDVIAADCTVENVFYDNKWSDIHKGKTVQAIFDRAMKRMME